MDASRTILDDAVVWVADGTISDVTAAGQVPPAHAGSPVVATAGTIYPGMIELHNHLAYNTLPLFQIPRLYTMREQWQGTTGYRRYVSGPAGVIASLPDLIRATIRYVECKSLLAGTTTSQGLTLRTTAIKHLYQGMVRNAELPDAAGLIPARPKIGDVTPDELASFRESLAEPGTRILHLAEGLSTSPARQHFLDLQAPDGTWAISPALAGIHATGLNDDDLAIIGQHGGSIIWSPFSNLILYGDTAHVAVAIDRGITVALGSDWSPTASKNLLNELKVAQMHAGDLQLGITDRQLVEMVTTNPAQILGWQASLGSIEQGKLADLTVVTGDTADPYSQLIDATESDIQLVIIGGTGRYGTPDLLARVSPVDEQFAVAGETRGFHLDTKDPDPVLGTISLGEAASVLADALEHMPERAAAIEPDGLGLVAAEGIAGAAAGDRWFLELDQPAAAGLGAAESPDTMPALVDAAIAGQSFASIAVPIALDPLATKGDDAYFAMLANLTNVPDTIRSGLPGRYGEVPRQPAEVAGLADDDRPIAFVP
jgi:cytosine/adenosine deaminase-related metal-dependent hydrolase